MNALTLAPDLSWRLDGDDERAASITHEFAIAPHGRGWCLEVHGRFLPGRPLARVESDDRVLLRRTAAEYAVLFGAGDDIVRMGLALRRASDPTCEFAL